MKLDLVKVAVKAALTALQTKAVDFGPQNTAIVVLALTVLAAVLS